MSQGLEERRIRAEAIATKLIDCAIKVHRELGPGLLESVYQKCLMIELRNRGLSAKAEAPIGFLYCGEEIDVGFRADIIVEDLVLVELKATERLTPLHLAQTITYLKLANYPLGLLANFNVVLLKEGIRRVVHPSFLRSSEHTKSD